MSDDWIVLGWLVFMGGLVALAVVLTVLGLTGVIG